MSRAATVGVVFGLVTASCVVETTETLVQSADNAPITVSPRASAISEAGDGAYFTVSLQSPPRAPVRIDITIDPASEARAVPSTLIFMPQGGAQQSFQVVAVDDDAFDGDIQLAVKLNVLSADPQYRYQPPPLDVLSIDDDYVVTGYRAIRLFGDNEVGESMHLNNRSQVIADVAFAPSNNIAMALWDNGVVTDFGYPTRAMDINDAGTIVGFYSDDPVRSFRYADGTFTTLPGWVTAINEQGDMVGDALYVNGQRTELRGADPVTGQAINSHDHVTGLFPTPPYYEYAFYWNGQFINLGSMGGPRAAGAAINEHDQLVGFMWDSQINSHAFYYDGGAVIDLGTATNLPGALATGINNRGDIAGYDFDGGFLGVGWVGRAGGPLTTLQSQVVDGTCFSNMAVSEINDRGEILVRGWECDVGSPRGYLLEPIKAPRVQ